MVAISRWARGGIGCWGSRLALPLQPRQGAREAGLVLQGLLPRAWAQLGDRHRGEGDHIGGAQPTGQQQGHLAKFSTVSAL